MDPYFLNRVAHANCYKGIFDVDGNPVRIKPAEKSVLVSIAFASVCDVDLEQAVKVSAVKNGGGVSWECEEQEQKYLTISDIGRLLKNQRIVHDGANTRVEELEGCEISDIAARCSYTYHRTGTILRKLINMGVVKVARRRYSIVCGSLCFNNQAVREKRFD